LTKQKYKPYKKKSAGTVLATYPAYWAFELPLVKDKQRSAHADMSVIQWYQQQGALGKRHHDTASVCL